MNKKIIKFLFMLGVVILINIAMTTISNANLSISTSKSTVSPGETFSVTVSVSGDEAGEATLTVSNGTLSQKNVDLMSQSSVTVNCTAGNSGTINISASGLIANYKTETEEKQSASKSVTINTPAPEPKPEPKPEPEPTPEPTPSKSSDTSLKSLTVSPFGNLKSPYDITVDNKYDKVTISAVANDSNAKVSGKLGEFNLEEGTNQFKITVTAEDGSQQTYSVYVRRKVAETTEPITPPNVVDENKEEEKPQETENKNEELGLKNLVITGIELNPSFKTDVYEYKAEFAENIDTLEIIATPNIEGATFEVIGNSNLKIGENLITIILKSEDGETTKTYQILVTKNEPQVALNEVDTNNEITGAVDSQNLKNRIGKIILIAVAAVIAVILMGIIAIVNTRRKSDNDTFNDDESFDKKEKINKNDFRVAVDEEESYRELEKLSNIREKKNELASNEEETIENKEENISSETEVEKVNEKENETVDDDIAKFDTTGDMNTTSENMNNLDNISKTEFGTDFIPDTTINSVTPEKTGSENSAKLDFEDSVVEETKKPKKGKAKGKRFK